MTTLEQNIADIAEAIGIEPSGLKYALEDGGYVIVKREDVKSIAHKLRLMSSGKTFRSPLFSHRQIMYDWEHIVGRMEHSPNLPGDEAEVKHRQSPPRQNKDI